MLARNILRSTQRATPSLRSASRQITPTFSRQTLRIAPRAVAAFSTTRIQRDGDIKAELAAKLTSEIQYETADLEEKKKDTNGYGANIESFLNEGIWKLHDTAGSEEVVLTRTYEDETIKVTFSCADFNQDQETDDADEALMDEDEDMMETQSGGANTKGSINQGRTGGGNFKVGPEDDIAPADREELMNSEDAADMAFSVNVNVSVRRPGKGSLNFGTLASEGSLEILDIAYLPEELADQETAEAHYKRNSLYTGPPFSQLDEEVQMMIERYLEERNVSTSLALFVPEYIDRKENEEYVAWLSKIKNFVE